MARRFEHFGVRPGRRQWQLLAPLRARRPARRQDVRPRPPADAAEHAAVAALWHRRAGREELPGRAAVLIADSEVTGAVWYDPDAGERTEYGTAGRIVAVLAEPGREEVRADLVAAAMTGLRDRGLRVAAITVDAEDQALTRDCRLLGFRHDRTDVEYLVGDVSGAARRPGLAAAAAAEAGR